MIAGDGNRRPGASRRRARRRISGGAVHCKVERNGPKVNGNRGLLVGVNNGRVRVGNARVGGGDSCELRGIEDAGWRSTCCSQCKKVAEFLRDWGALSVGGLETRVDHEEGGVRNGLHYHAKDLLHGKLDWKVKVSQEPDHVHRDVDGFCAAGRRGSNL